MSDFFCTYEQAKKLKQLGFNEECRGFYDGEYPRSMHPLFWCFVDDDLAQLSYTGSESTNTNEEMSEWDAYDENTLITIG